MVEEGKEESSDPEQEPDLFPPDLDGSDPGQRWKGATEAAYRRSDAAKIFYCPACIMGKGTERPGPTSQLPWWS